MNKLNRIIFVLSLLAAGFAGAVEAADSAKQAHLIYAGKALLRAGEPVRSEVSILVAEGKIVRISDGFVGVDTISGFDRVTTIDLSDRFVLPGLMDAHVHLLMLYQADRNKSTTEGQDAINGVYNAKLTLEAGFTTVRDLGAPNSAIFALRDAIAGGRVPGPRILAAGSAIAVTGGHGDSTGYDHHSWKQNIAGGICDGVAECRKAVRRQIKRSADVIKITATGGGGKPQGGPDADPEFFEDEFTAAVDTAHRLGKKVAVHAHGTKGIKMALRAGVDSVEHSTFLDKEGMTLFERNDIFMVPTLSVRDNLMKSSEDAPAYIRERERYIVEITPKVMGEALRRGVKFANGSDAGVVIHGNNVRELEWLVEIGMTPEQALAAATLNTAELFGLSDQIGALQEGMLADIIAVQGDPLTNISDLRKIDFVMKSGTVYPFAASE